MDKIELENQLLVHAFDYAAIGKAIVAVDGAILKVNHSLCHLLGYQESELLKLSFQEITHPDDLAVDQSKLNLLLEGKINSFHTEKRYVHKNNDEIWAFLSLTLVRSNQGDPLYFVSQIQNITDRKLAEKKVYEGEKRYQRIVEESPDAIIILRKGKCFFINEAGVGLLGASAKKDIIGKSIYEFIDNRDYGKLQNLVETKIRCESVGPIEERFVRFDGKEIDVEIKTIPTIYKGQPAIHAIVRDISERKQTQELMINSEKLTVAGQLAAGIAHEVRNPLTAIKGFLQIMESGLKDQKMYFEIISSEMNRIEMILNELLVLSRPQQITKYTKGNLKVIIEQIVTLLQTQTNMNSIEIITKIEHNLPLIHCDENQLKQVFINFLKNSIEAMPKGGAITIEVQSKSSESLIVRIVDQGHGIPEHLLKKIGTPFFTTKENGTGLGLMICKQIIEQHKGIINIESCSKGTTIEINLPVS